MKKRRKKRTEMDNPSPIEIRNHANGRLDEIVARGANAHLEQMDSNYWWMGLQLAGRHFHVRFSSAKGIRVTVDEDTPEGARTLAPSPSAV
jgi:hypothetical protein